MKRLRIIGKVFPSTPAEALEIPAPLRIIMSVVSALADIFGFWRRPAKKAATDLPEMTLVDKLYWAYKSSRPVTRPERGTYGEHFFRQQGLSMGLPEGFVKTSGVTFGAAGDLIGVDGLEASRDVLYDEIADLIFGQDVSYASLESQVTDKEVVKEVLSDKESPIESCSVGQYNAMKGHRGRNYTILHAACNHTLDMGIEGVEATLSRLEEDTIVALGINKEPAGLGKGKIVTVKGIKIGFAAVTFGLNGKEPPRGKEYMIEVARLHPRKGRPDLVTVKRQIDSCRGQGCDLIIASLHWGYEFEFFPRRKQIEIAQALVEYGADVIIGHHPHVVQPVEYYQTARDDRRVAVIAYSLGSLTWSFSAPHLVLSAVLNLSLAKGMFRGQERTYIEKAMVTPVFRARIDSGNGEAIQMRKLYDDSIDLEDRETRQYVTEIRRFSELVFGADKQSFTGMT